MRNINPYLGKVRTALVLCLILTLAGCAQHESSASSPARDGSKKLSTIKTVCMVELKNKTSYPQISGDITESLYQSIQKKQVFTLSLLKQTDPAFNTLDVKPDSAYTLEQLMAARKLLGTDALLIGTVTGYSPYPHMTIGLQMKLVDLRTGQVLWAIQQVWDSSDKTIQERIKKYFDRQLRSDFSTIGDHLATLSPINFVKFITYEVTETL